MRLVFINYPLETFTPTQSGALATIIWECCRIAKSEGVEPTVITRTSQVPRFPWPQTILIDPPSVPEDPLIEKLYRVERKLTGWRLLRQRAYALRVVSAIGKAGLEQSSFVLINDPEMAVFLRRRCPKSRILHWFQNQQECKPRFRSQFAASADVVCGVSDFTSRWIAEYYGVKEVATLYNGVDVEQFYPSSQSPEGVPVINFVGRTGIEKAPDLLLKAGIALMAKTSHFGLQLVGSNHWDRFELDVYQRELQELVDQLTRGGIEVRRPGHVGRNALPAEFQKAQIHVVPSRWDEAFGLSTVEGMASGLAVIASNTGGTPEVVGESGTLFPRDSVEGLTEALFSLITDEGLRHERKRRARERALEFTWNRTWSGLKNQIGM